jgi:hypothetical protein
MPCYAIMQSNTNPTAHASYICTYASAYSYTAAATAKAVSYDLR